MSDRRQRAAAIALLALGAVAIWVSVGQAWAQAEVEAVTELGAAELARDVPGRELAAGAVAAGWVGAAGIAAVVATRGRGRVLVGWLLAVAGAIGAWSVLVAAAPWGLPRVLALAGAAAIAAAGLIVALRGGRWAGSGQRYERRPDTGPRATWDALDRGEDPTAS